MRAINALASGAAACILLLSGPVASATAGQPMTLGPGDVVFWNGETVSGNVPSADACDVAAPCFGYAVRLTAPGARLRVAIDTPSREDSFRVEAIAPDGSVAASVQNSNQFNEELFVKDPAAGDWTVRVMPAGATRAFFRLRAKLEASLAPQPAGRVPLLPNLRTVPPYELGFVAPANPLNGLYPPDTVNPPADVGGVHPVSCTADEMAPDEVGGFEAERCLRLTSGPINVGAGPYDMRFTFAADTAEGEAEMALERGTIGRGPIFQAVHFSDGSMELRPAGRYSFHVTHGHFHDDNVLTYELLRVADAAAGALEPAGEGTKSGFCPADQLFGEWRVFAQQPSGTFGEGDSAAGGNCFSPTDGFIGLTVGWGDVYRWQRPGQYVEFGSNGDGLYVVRATVDKPNHVIEINEDDNASYALVRIAGERIDLLERGQGLSPWDPAKTVFEGSGPADLGPYEGTVLAASEGSAPAGSDCTVPRLRGLTLNRAKARLRTAGCRLGRVRRVRAAGRRVVRAQRPAPGTVARRGKRVAVRLG